MKKSLSPASESDEHPRDLLRRYDLSIGIITTLPALSAHRKLFA